MPQERMAGRERIPLVGGDRADLRQVLDLQTGSGAACDSSCSR
jgi:hypothetical protein